MASAVAYDAALANGRKVGASNCSDAELMALFCESPSLQILCGAVSGQLVWEGAQKSELTATQLAELAANDAHAVAELMWV